MRDQLPVVVLAGGKSTRLGRDKASEVLVGRTLLQRAVDACAGLASSYVVVRSRDQLLPSLDLQASLTVIEDAYAETGPLGGLCTGLSALKHAHSPGRQGGADRPPETPGRHALVLACDMPLLQPALLSELVRLARRGDAVVPVLDGRPQPLCAVYAARCAGPARALLDQGDYRLGGLVGVVDAVLVPEEQWRPFDPEALSFLNVNREEDLARAKHIIERAAG